MEQEPVGVVTLVAAGLCLGMFWRLVRPAIDRSRWRVAADLSAPGLMLAALSIVTFVVVFQFFSVTALIILVVGIAVHEYGHVLGYRLAGHAAPVFRLLPFGGMATSEQSAQSQAENAFVALMGPGFSLVLVVLAELVRGLFSGGLPTSPDWRTQVADLAYTTVVFVSLLNLLNMLPFFPLDGGRALHAILTVAGRRVALAATLVLSTLAGVVGLAQPSALLILLALIGGLAALSEDKRDAELPGMSVGESLLTTLLFAAIVGAYLAALSPEISRQIAIYDARSQQSTGAPPL